MLKFVCKLNGNGDWAAGWYVTKDARQGALFVFRLASRQTTHEWAFPGLDPQARYRLSTPEGSQATPRGAELAVGFAVTLPDPYRSALFFVEQLF
ncbi:MAG: GH36 C-terminal domain-containing protein [Caldilineaceae bacterium]